MSLLQIAIFIYCIVLLATQRKILLQVKSPSKTLSWLLVVMFLPVVGILFYRFMGRSVKKDKLFQLKLPFYNNNAEVLIGEHIPTSKHNLIRLLHKNNSAAISYDNNVAVLKDGIETFTELFNSLRGAQHTIHLNFYIVESGKILNELMLILEERVKNGVKVRFLYDGFGSLDLEQGYKVQMKDKGIDFIEFMPFNLFTYFDYINYRNHRKIVIIDNRIAFTGGMNITDKYTSVDRSIGLWHDTFIKVEGNAAKDFERIFHCDWFYAKGLPYEIDSSNYPSTAKGETVVQVISSGPDSVYKGIMQEYFTIITDAEDYVYIVTPYFVPGDAILTALKTSALSGIDVRLMLPFVSDSKWLKWCMFTFLEDLLAAGVRIYLYHDGFLHSKVVISDDIISSIGTANVDARSFDTNFEVNAVVYCRETSETLKTHFFEDIKSCEELQLSSFRNRRDRNRIMEAVARLSSPML